MACNQGPCATKLPLFGQAVGAYLQESHAHDMALHVLKQFYHQVRECMFKCREREREREMRRRAFEVFPCILPYPG